MDTCTIRLLPGQDLSKSISDYVYNHHIAAGCILTCVGSLTSAIIRFANKPDATKVEGHFEIDSLVGTVGMAGQQGGRVTRSLTGMDN